MLKLSNSELHNKIIEFILHLVIKLQRYEEALNDCNTVLAMDYKNIKALLRRALSLERLEEAYEVNIKIIRINVHINL